MNILITGIAGFIWSKIAEAAIKLGYNVFGIDDLSQGYLKNIPEGVDFIEADLSDANQLQKLPRNINIIMHLAGQSSGEISFDNPTLDLKKNTFSTINLIEYGVQIKAERIIHASSMSVYGVTKDEPISETSMFSPLSCYGVGKLAAENYLNVYKDRLPYIVFRMFNVYGPGQDMSNLRQGMVSIYLQHALTSTHIPVKGSLNRFRDFIYIDDVVDIWLQAINNQYALNRVFNLGTGVKTTVEDLLLKMRTLIPEVSWSEIPGTPGDQFGIYADINLLQNVFELNKQTSLQIGLETFIASLGSTYQCELQRSRF